VSMPFGVPEWDGAQVSRARMAAAAEVRFQQHLSGHGANAKDEAVFKEEYARSTVFSLIENNREWFHDPEYVPRGKKVAAKKSGGESSAGGQPKKKKTKKAPTSPELVDITSDDDGSRSIKTEYTGRASVTSGRSSGSARAGPPSARKKKQSGKDNSGRLVLRGGIDAGWASSDGGEVGRKLVPLGVSTATLVAADGVMTTFARVRGHIQMCRYDLDAPAFRSMARVQAALAPLKKREDDASDESSDDDN
jgi:hypothetical protein